MGWARAFVAIKGKTKEGFEIGCKPKFWRVLQALHQANRKIKSFRPSFIGNNMLRIEVDKLIVFSGDFHTFWCVVTTIKTTHL